MGKASRRKQEKRDSKDLVGEISYFAANKEQQLAGHILSDGPAPEKVLDVTAKAHSFADDGIAAMKDHLGRALRLACKPGCDACCFGPVLVTAPEVLSVVRHLNDAPAALNIVRQNIATVTEMTRNLGPDDYTGAKIACPLLDDGRCIAYPVRPLNCRGLNSISPEDCRGDQAAIFAPLLAVAAGVRAGLERALTKANLDGNLYELSTALKTALETPDPMAEWLAGESIFGQAIAPTET